MWEQRAEQPLGIGTAVLDFRQRTRQSANITLSNLFRPSVDVHSRPLA